MTVSATTNLVTYTGTGSTANFQVPFRFLQNSDLVVTVTTPAGAVSTLVLNTDYTVTGAALYAGGSITLTAGNLTLNYVITIWRNPAAVQNTSLQNQGSYNATAVETALDLLTMQNDAQTTVDGTCIRGWPGEAASMQLPVASLRALKNIAFDSSGNVIASSTLSGTIVSSPMIPVVTAVSTAVAVQALGLEQSVLNVASLRLVAVPTLNGVQIATTGYYSLGDLGAGIYTWNASDARADNGGTVIQITGNPTGRWNLRSPYFDLNQFGAHGDGVTDDLTFINAAITAANAAGGGVVTVSGSTFIHSAAITMKANVTIRGVGKMISVFKSAHTGDGITMTSPINTSTNVSTAVYDVQFWNTNGSNTGAAYDDVGGTFGYLHNCRFRGFAYGTILDQSELYDINLCDYEANLTSGIWLVNGSEHTPSANALFTNRIGITKCQFNEGAAAWGIIDDGGNSHEFYDNNFNGCVSHIRIAGTQNLSVRDSEFESGASFCVVMSNLGIFGGAKGASINTHFLNCEFVPVAGQGVCNIVSAAIISWQQCYFGNTASVKVQGVANVAEMSFWDCFNAGGGATFTGSSTKMMAYDNNGFTLYQSGNGAAIKAHLSNTAALSFGAPGAVPGAVDLTITVSGAVLGDTVDFASGVAIPANYLATAWVDSANTVKVRLLQFAGAATAQNLGTCRVGVWQH